MENRRHYRFSSTAFLNRPVHLEPISPFFGHEVEGKLIDLSGGGMSLLIDETIPQGTGLRMCATFPDGVQLDCFVQVRHTFPRTEGVLHGIEFLNLPTPLVDRIEKMSRDYIDCETRKSNKRSEVCQTDCACLSICTKIEKINPILTSDPMIEFAFKTLPDSSVFKTTHLKF